MIWILKACVGYASFIGTCGQYIIQPYQSKADCMEAVAMLESRKHVDWVICFPEQKK
jgi:hypothetical protein